MIRDHVPVKIEEFNGLWKRGDAESCPLDHFTDCNNIQYDESSFRTRDGVEIYGTGDQSLVPNVVRMYNYSHGAVQGILALDDAGNIYDTGSPTPLVPILSIAAMTDFAFVPFAGRAYISPHDGNLGLQSEFVYVYLGDGQPAVKAAGNPPSSSMTVSLNPPGHIEVGWRNVAVLYETNTGFLTAPAINAGNASIQTTGAHKLDFANIPTGPSNVVKRHIVITKAIPATSFTGNELGYTFYFMPGGTIDDNTTTSLTDIDFYDSELLDDASRLLDNYGEIPAGVNLSVYHNRLTVEGLYGTPNTDPQLDESSKWSTVLVSLPGEPEAISQVDGFIVVPLDGKPITASQEYRDVLYVFKSTRTFSYVDNGDVPSSWPLVVVDQGIGCSIHGIATVLDSGGVNVEFLLIADYSGVMLFNGSYPRPELSYKIRDLWLSYDRDDFKNIQFINNSIDQFLYIALPDKTLLFADYSTGLDPKSIKWAPWTFDLQVSTITLLNTNILAIGSAGQMP